MNMHRDTGQCPGCQIVRVQRRGVTVRLLAASGHVLADVTNDDEVEARHVARMAASAHGARLEE